MLAGQKQQKLTDGFGDFAIRLVGIGEHVAEGRLLGLFGWHNGWLQMTGGKRREQK
jgi:hypothetical protein